MLVYKIDVLQKLKEKGYSSYILRNDHLLSQKTLQDLRHGVVVGNIALDRICGMLELQPGSIIKWVPDEEVSDGKEAVDD